MSRHERVNEALRWLQEHSSVTYPEGSIGDLRQKSQATSLADLMERREQDLMAFYSAALDEIYYLRGICAYEARVTEAHLEYKTFPKSRREVAERQAGRLRAAARGHWKSAKQDYPSYEPKRSLWDAGASETLTRSEFEDQQRELLGGTHLKNLGKRGGAW